MMIAMTMISKMFRILANDPVTNPFNNWLKANGIYVAIGFAALLLIIVIVIFILSLKKNRH